MIVLCSCHSIFVQFQLLFVLCHLLFLLSEFTTSYGRTIIHVNDTIVAPANTCTGTQQELTCPTLNLALQALTTSSIIYLYPTAKEYSLEPGNETRIWNQSDISIIGQDNDGDIVTINCHNKAGLAFVQCNNIILKSVSFLNCSQTQTSSSRDFRNSSRTFRYLEYKVAIYIKFCINVMFSRVTVQNSNGVGVTMYNTVGNVSIMDSNFIANNRKDTGHYEPGGGGLQIELCDTLLSNDLAMQFGAGHEYSSGAHYSITNTKFNKNQAHYRLSYVIFRPNVYVPDDTTNTFNFGKGGGFHIILRGQASNNTFIIDENCVIANNIAHVGGGFYIAFQNSTCNNFVSLRHSNIHTNTNFDIDLRTKDRVFDIDGGGGGGKILYDSINRMSNNVIEVSDCLFATNEGISGGALWIESVLELDSENNLITIKNTNFFSNKAFLGSALYFSGQFSKNVARVIFRHVNCSSNIPICDKQLALHSAFLPCTGILYSINFPITFQGVMRFKKNTASAIEVHGGSLNVTNGTELIFIENTSQYGGALALYDCSYMTIHPNTSLTFINNNAKISGGAIYSASCSGSGQPISPSFKCFVQYSDPSVHPEKWRTSLHFVNNTLTLEDGHSRIINDMYVTSLSACWQPKYGSNIIKKSDYGETFCWSPWKFSGKCNTSYQSSPAFVDFSHSMPNDTKVYPGQSLLRPDVYDGRFFKVEVNSIIACVLYGPGSFSSTTTKSCKQFQANIDILLFRQSSASLNDNKDVLISIHLDNKFSYGPSFVVSFKTCEWPFKNASTHSHCIYGRSNDFHCINSTDNQCSIGTTVSPKHPFCITNMTDIGLIIGQCPPLYNNKPLMKWHNSKIQSLTDSCQYNKSGVLCGGCVEQYGVPVNSLHYACYDCRKSVVPGSILFLILQMIPLTLFVLSVFVLNITMTTGVASGFIFYWQIITLNFPAWFYPAWFTFTDAPNSNDTIVNSDFARFMTFLYSVTNLNFLVIYSPAHMFPVCITNNMTSLGVIAFWYIVPVYTLVLVGLLITWLLLYDRGWPCVVMFTRPVHVCLARFWGRFNIKPSLVSSVASLYVLCFTEISATSFKLLHFSTWQSLHNETVGGKVSFYDGNMEYFGVPHLFYGSLAIVMLLVLVLIPMLFVVLFPSRLFHRFVLDKIKLPKVKNALISLGDTYTGCYKDSSDGKHSDFRYFAGIFLCIRLMIMSFYYIPGQYSKLILYLETVTLIIVACLVMTLRPYKRKSVNFTNCFLLILLALMTTLCLFFEKYGVFINLVIIMHLPLVMAVILIIKRLKESRKKQTTNDKYDDLPDRLEQPGYMEAFDEKDDAATWHSASQRSRITQDDSKDSEVPLRSVVPCYGTI